MKHLKTFEQNIGNNTFSKEEFELLNLCYFSSNYDRIKKLIDNNPNININCKRDDYGWTPLLIAVNNCNYKIAKLLLDNGANPNIFSDVSQKGKFPFDNDTVFDKLLSSGYDIHNQSESKIKEYWNFLNILIPYLDINKQTSIFKRNGLLRVAESTAPNNISFNGITSFAMKFNFETAIKLLRKILKRNPDLTLKDYKNMDFMDHLIKNNSTEIIYILCNEFPEVEAYYNLKKYNL